MAKYEHCDVRQLLEEGSSVGLFARGHHDAETFIAACREQWAKLVQPEDVHQTHWRILPPNEDGEQWYQPSSPGRGAFPVTVTEYALDIPTEALGVLA